MRDVPRVAGLSPVIAKALERSRRARTVQGVRQVLRDAQTPLEFMDPLIEAGVPADVTKRLTFEHREFWRMIYGSMLDHRSCVKSSAQVGKTIMLMYEIVTLAHLDHYRGRGVWLGFYLPNREMARIMSSARFRQILTAVGRITGVPCGDSNGEEARANLDAKAAAVLARVLAERDVDEVDGDDAIRQFVDAEGAEVDMGRRRQDSFNLKQIARSFILLGWINGDGVDAFPIDRLLLDEVRLMSPARVDRVEKRIQGSDIATITWTSTAGMPGDAIDVRWLDSKQFKFHNDCRCPDGVILNETWPRCLGERRGEDIDRRFYLYCPKCGAEITERNKGRWHAHNPDGLYNGFNPHQLLTQRRLPDIVQDYRRADSDVGEFMRSVLGLEHTDPESVTLTRDHLDACVDDDLLWAQPGDVSNCAMGLDHGGGYNHYVIKRRGENGKMQTVHVEVNFDENPFARAAQLMREYDVSLCCLEPLPNWNDAHRFASSFPARVFLVHWITASQYPERGRALRWLDKPETDEDKKAAAETKWKYTVRAHRTTALDAVVTAWRNRAVECPSPKALTARVPDQWGNPVTVCVGEDLYFDHLQRLAKRRISESKLADGVEVREATGVVKHHYVKLAAVPGGRRPVSVAGNAADPHFFFAEALACIAYTRLPQWRGIRVRY